MKKLTWNQVWKIADKFNAHYAMQPVQQELVFKYGQQIPKDGLALEIGIAHGKTASILIMLSKVYNFKYVGIDNFSLDSSYEVVKRNLDQLDIPYELINKDSKQVVWDRPLDFLIIDGGHAYAEVYNDCSKFIKHIKPGGFLFLHDYANPENYSPQSPHWAINYYGEMYTYGWEDLGLYQNQLKIKRRPLDMLEHVIKEPDLPKGTQ